MQNSEKSKKSQHICFLMINNLQAGQKAAIEEAILNCLKLEERKHIAEISVEENIAQLTIKDKSTAAALSLKTYLPEFPLSLTKDQQTSPRVYANPSALAAFQNEKEFAKIRFYSHLLSDLSFYTAASEISDEKFMALMGEYLSQIGQHKYTDKMTNQFSTNEVFQELYQQVVWNQLVQKYGKSELLKKISFPADKTVLDRVNDFDFCLEKHNFSEEQMYEIQPESHHPGRRCPFTKIACSSCNRPYLYMTQARHEATCAKASHVDLDTYQESLLIVQNFPKQRANFDIKAFFSQFGEVQNFSFKMEEKTDVLNFFCKFSTIQEGAYAKEQVDGLYILGKKVAIEYHKSRQDLQKCRVYLEGLETNEECKIREIFQQYGPIKMVKLLKAHQNKKGIGYVEFMFTKTALFLIENVKEINHSSIGSNIRLLAYNLDIQEKVKWRQDYEEQFQYQQQFQQQHQNPHFQYCQYPRKNNNKFHKNRNYQNKNAHPGYYYFQPVFPVQNFEDYNSMMQYQQQFFQQQQQQQFWGEGHSFVRRHKKRNQKNPNCNGNQQPFPFPQLLKIDQVSQQETLIEQNPKQQQKAENVRLQEQPKPVQNTQQKQQKEKVEDSKVVQEQIQIQCDSKQVKQKSTENQKIQTNDQTPIAIKAEETTSDSEN